MATDPAVEGARGDGPGTASWPGSATPPRGDTGDTGDSDAGDDSSTFLIGGLFPPPAPASAPLPLEGTIVNGVRIRRLIGEGGMGRVYEGWSEKLGKSFAVKLIRPGVADPALVSLHMNREAAILARLHHPGIARIFWFGTEEIEGAQVPYFIMEYVAGAKTITAFASHRNLSVRERIELFRQVCDAVAAGHALGVTHRDLKPLNILVDEGGHPKVIDFGVARMTNADLTMTTMDATRLVGTPTHMSPEQFAGRESGIDARTDVYALGVVLYQLLAGRLPLEFRDKPIYEIARAVIEEEPPSLASLVPRLPRDVGVIAAHCLQKEKSLRYANAAELRDDLGRFLAGEPIMAAAPSAWLSIRRFARRHRAVTVAAAGVVAAFLVAFAGILAFALESRAQQRRTEMILGMATGLLAAGVPEPDAPADSGSDDGRISPRELLRRQRSRVETYEDDEARATLLQAIGKAFLDLGEYAEAKDAARDAHALWLSVRGEHAPETLASLSLLTTSLLCMDDMQDAVARAESLVQGCRSRYESGHPRAVESQLLLARARRRAGDLDEALRITAAAATESEARNGPEHRDTLVAQNNLGVLYSEAGRFPDAIACYERAHAAATTAFGRDDRDALQFGHNLGVAHLRAAAAGARAAGGDADRTRDEGIRRLEEVCQLRQAVLGTEHSESLATLHELAKALEARGLAARAVAILVPCRDILDARAAAGDATARESLDLLRRVGEMVGGEPAPQEWPPFIEQTFQDEAFPKPVHARDRDAVARPDVAERLARPLTLVFGKDTLERAVQMVAEEIGVPIEIGVGDLQLEGITKNQSFRLDERNRPAGEVLRTILRKADSEGRLVYVIRKRDGAAFIDITTRAAAERRGDELPPEFHEQGADAPRGGRR